MWRLKGAGRSSRASATTTSQPTTNAKSHHTIITHQHHHHHVNTQTTAVLALFTLPKLYELRKDDVDAGLSTATAAAERHLTTARAKVEEVVSRLTPRKAPPPAPVSKDE